MKLALKKKVLPFLSLAAFIMLLYPGNKTHLSVWTAVAAVLSGLFFCTKAGDAVASLFHFSRWHIARIAVSVLAVLFLTLSGYDTFSYTAIFAKAEFLTGISKELLQLITVGLLSVAAMPFAVSLSCAFSETLSDKIDLPSGEKQYIDIWDILFLAALCFLITVCFRSYPFYSGHEDSTDYSVFVYIGKRMHEGALPYKDLFDHKGPFLYLIQYIGTGLFPGSDTGIWLIEYVGMFVTLFCSLKIVRLFSKSRFAGYAAVALVFAVIGKNVYQGGNLTEPYALPWIVSSLYIFFAYFKSKRFSFGQMVLLGVGFAAVLLLRVNMVNVWAAFIPLVLTGLIVRKEWKNLGRAAAGFIAGCGIVCIPMLILLVKTGTLSSMIECYMRFNFTYTSNVQTLSEKLETASKLLRIMTFIAPSVLAFSLLLFNRSKLIISNFWFAVISMLLAYIGGRAYPHYNITVLPALLAPLTCFFSVIVGWIGEHKLPFVSLRLVSDGCNAFLSVFAVLLLAVILTKTGPVAFYSGHTFLSGENDPAVSYIKETTLPDDDVLVIGNKCILYLATGRKTANKYFYQIPPVNESDVLYLDFLKECKEHPSDLIVITGNYEKKKTNIGAFVRLLNEQCEQGKYIRETVDNYAAYRRTEKEN